MDGHDEPTQVSGANGRGADDRFGSQVTIDRDIDPVENRYTAEPSPFTRGKSSSPRPTPETDANAAIDQLLSDVISSQAKPAKAARQTAWSYAWTSGGTPEAPIVASTPRGGSPKAKIKKSQDAPHDKRHRQGGGPKNVAATTDDGSSGHHPQRTQSKRPPKTPMQASGRVDDPPNDQYAASCNHQDASSQVNLYEYEKAKPIKQNRYSEYYKYHRDLHPYHRKSSRGGKEEEEEDDDDQFNVFICLLFCIMGLGVIIGLIILLCQYVDQKEQEQEKAGMGGPVDENCLGLLNSVYYKRLAQLIERVDNTTLAMTRLRNEKLLELCPLEPPFIVTSLHWLPINHRISYKLASLCYKCLNDSAPPTIFAPVSALYSIPSTPLGF